MFDKKADTLLPKPRSVAKGPTSSFITAGLKKTSMTRSGNDALKYTTTGRPFVDEFGTCSRFRAPRSFDDVSKSMSTLWKEAQLLCVKFALYLRMITRRVQFPDGTETEETQRGQGLRHEGIFRMMWLAVYHPKTFWKNIYLMVAVGGWKDIVTMLSYDLQYNKWEGRKLDWSQMGQLLMAGLENPRTTNLVKKYLPQIQANSKCKTLEAQADNMIAKWLCSLLFGGKAEANTAGNYRRYRKLKTSGTAHQWQQVISSGNLLRLDFNTIHGRALALLVSGKFIKNNKLEKKYGDWIASKPVAKFTGYVYELVRSMKSGMVKYEIDTINAQFMKLVEVAKVKLSDQGIRPISVIDDSGSMSSPMYIGSGKVGKMHSISVAVSSAIFFDEMMPETSPFKDVYLIFSDKTKMCKFTGSNFYEKYTTFGINMGGGTNFESVFQFFADFRKTNPHVPESEIPNFILCWSDGEFNRVSGYGGAMKTNVEKGREILRAAGYSHNFYSTFGIGFVELPNTFYGREPEPKFETYGDLKNVFYFSGHDLSPLAFLFGTSSSKGLPTTAEELFEAAMDQEVLNMVEL